MKTVAMACFGSSMVRAARTNVARAVRILTNAALQTACCPSDARSGPLFTDSVTCNNVILWQSPLLTPVKERIMQSQRLLVPWVPAVPAAPAVLVAPCSLLPPA